MGFLPVHHKLLVAFSAREEMEVFLGLRPAPAGQAISCEGDIGY